MMKLLRLIGLCMLLFSLGQMAINVSAIEVTDVAPVSEEAYVSVSQDSQMPADLEFAMSMAKVQLLAQVRTLRIGSVTCHFSLRGLAVRLLQRMARFFPNDEKWNTTVSHCCCGSVCDYYIYALRRILI